MTIGPKMRALRLAAFAALFSSLLSAQFGTEGMADKDLGRPPQPPFITFFGIVTPGKMATDPSLPLQGPVAEVFFEELRAAATPAGPAGEVFISVKTKYDEQARPLEVIRKEYGSETNTVNRYEGNRVVSQETTFPNSKSPRPRVGLTGPMTNLANSPNTSGAAATRSRITLRTSSAIRRDAS